MNIYGKIFCGLGIPGLIVLTVIVSRKVVKALNANIKSEEDTLYKACQYGQKG